MTSGTFTDLGLARLAQAYGSGAQIIITEMAFGDGAAAANPAALALQNERYRAPIDDRYSDPLAANTMVFTARLGPDTDLEPFSLREIGLYDQDGYLIALSATSLIDLTTAALSDQTLDLLIEFRLSSAHASALTINADPNLVYATRQYVDGQDAALEARIKSTPIQNLWRGHL